MKISDIRDPAAFQRLVHRLMVAERGADFHIPDDSGGDRGNDGYDADRGILYAIYCPEKPDTADYRSKGLKDLQKAARLATQPGYSITRWVFVTPTPLREPLQAELRAVAATHSLAAGFLADAHLEDLLRRHPHVRDELPVLEYPRVAQQLEAIRAPLAPVRVFFTLESEVSDNDLPRLVSRHPGYRRYGPDLPLPDPPDGPPPGTLSCRLHQSDGFLDFSDGKLSGAGLLNFMGLGFPHIERPATHTVVRVRKSGLADATSGEPLCMQPEIQLELSNGGSSGPAKSISFHSPMEDTDTILRLCALDNVVFSDFLTPPMSSTPADSSSWSLYDLRGAHAHLTLTYFYIEGVVFLPEASWPRIQSMYLTIADRYIMSVPADAIKQQARGRSAIKIGGRAVAPTVELDFTIPEVDFDQQVSTAGLAV